MGSQFRVQGVGFRVGKLVRCRLGRRAAEAGHGGRIEVAQVGQRYSDQRGIRRRPVDWSDLRQGRTVEGVGSRKSRQRGLEGDDDSVRGRDPSRDLACDRITALPLSCLALSPSDAHMC